MAKPVKKISLIDRYLENGPEYEYINLRIEESLKEELNAVSERLEVSVTKLINIAIAHFISELKKENE